MTKTQLSLPKKIGFSAIMIALLLLFIEGCAWLGLKLLDQSFGIQYQPTLKLALSEPHKISLQKFINDEFGLTGYSQTLGWTNKPHVSTDDGIHKTNSLGLRETEEFSLEKPTDRIRLTTFGDSFTYGMEVGHKQTWQRHLEKLDARYQTLNFGIGAHGPDQAYMRYLDEGQDFKTDYVFIGYMSENIGRILNVYRPFYMPTTGIPVTKPRFVLSGNKLSTVPNPNKQLSDYQQLIDDPVAAMRSYGKEDYYYQRSYAQHPMAWSASVRLLQMASATLFNQPVYDRAGLYNTDGEGFRLLKQVLLEFYHQVERDGAHPVILISPQFIEVSRLTEGKQVKYQPLLDWLDQEGFAYIDLMDTILEFDKDHSIYDFFSRSRGHYSSAGNRAIAKSVQQYLQQHQRSLGNQ